VGRRSNIETLIPQAVQDQLAALFRAGKTIDQVKAKLDELHAAGETPVTASRSAVGRYIERTNAQFEDYRAAQTLSEKILPALGEQGRGEVGMLAAELIKLQCYEAASDIGDTKNLNAKIKQLMFLSAGLKNASSTTKEMHGSGIASGKKSHAGW
jgi:hypothetical protein